MRSAKSHRLACAGTSLGLGLSVQPVVSALGRDQAHGRGHLRAYEANWLPWRPCLRRQAEPLSGVNEMAVTPVKPQPQTIPIQSTQPQAPVKGGNDHDGDDAVGASKSSPTAHVGGLVDKDA